MCSPAAVGLGIMVGGSILQGVGGYQSSRDERELAFKNAEYLDMASADALLRGEKEAAIVQMKGSEMISKQRVGYAKGNIDVSTGSALDIQSATRILSDYDAQLVKSNAAREAWGYRVRAYEARKQGIAAEKRGWYGMYGSFLTGAGAFLGGIE